MYTIAATSPSRISSVYRVVKTLEQGWELVKELIGDAEDYGMPVIVIDGNQNVVFSFKEGDAKITRRADFLKQIRERAISNQEREMVEYCKIHQLKYTRSYYISKAQMARAGLDM